MGKGLKMWLEERDKASLLLFLLYTFAFMRFVLNFCTLTEKEYDTIRNFYYYRGVFWFLLVLLIENRALVINKLSIIYSAVSAVLIGIDIYKWRYSPDIIKLNSMKWLCCAMGIYLVLDMVIKKKLPKKGEYRIWFVALYLVANLLAFLNRKGGFLTPIPLFPLVLLFLVKMTKERWEKYVLALSFGYYLAFMVVMVKSLLLVPYTGKRYYGIYINHGLFGIFVGGAFICALYWLILSLQRKEIHTIFLILSGIAVLLSVIASVMITTRTAQLAMLIAVWGAYVFCPRAKEKKSWKFRLGISILALCVMIGVGLLLFTVLDRTQEDTITRLFKNEIISEKILYWKDRAATLFNPKHHDSIARDAGFKEGSLLNAMDRITSARLGWFAIYLKQSNLWGHKTMNVLTPSGIELAYPHSVFIAWIHMFGIPIGVLNIIWFLTGLVCLGIHLLKKGKAELFAFLFCLYATITMLSETVYWNVQVAFIALMCFYPIMLNLDGINETAMNKRKEKKGWSQYEKTLNQ